MDEQIDKLIDYKKRWFIEPTIKHNGYAFHAIRTSLLSSIAELKEKATGQVLDLGCGIMPYREFLTGNKKITEYIGIDLAVSNYHNTVKPDLFWDGKTIPLPDDSCDWVIATEFLEHYYHTDDILKEIRRVLKKNGTLFFTVPCIWPLHEVPYDEHRFTPYSLEKHFKNVGFEKITIKPLGGIDLSMAIMLGLWLDFSKLPTFKFKVLRKILSPVYNFLLKRDNKHFQFDNYTMPSGLYGFIEK